MTEMKNIIISGNHIDLVQLSEEMDEAFIKLYGGYLGNQPFDLNEFNETAINYFNEIIGNVEMQSHYFRNFWNIWNRYLRNGQYDDAYLVWQTALSPVISWENNNEDVYIHKGYPFYFWGMTALLKGELDLGYALMHQSVEEDVRTHNIPHPPTPAYLFATLDYANPNQAFRQWPLKQAQFLERLLLNYNSDYSKTFTLDQFRIKFLSSPPNRDIVFLFGYVLARLEALEDVPNYALASIFAGQLELNLLTDIALVIENALSYKSGLDGTFINQAEFLSNEAKLPLNDEKLKQLNSDFINDFERTLYLVLSGNYVFPDGIKINGHSKDIASTYGIRNRGAHDLTPTPIIWKRFLEIQQSLTNTLFYVIEVLY